MNEVKISIIIPVYNVEKYLPKCLDSIVNQTYKNLEIICVNDESPDGCLKILENYAEKDNRVKIVSQKNQGLSGARNTGAKYVTGDYIMYVDSDDWIEPDTCEIALNKALEQKADLVFWTYTREFENSSVPKKIFDQAEIVFDKEDTKNKLHRRLFGLYGEELSSPENADSIVTAWGKLYKAELIINHNIEFVDTKKIGTEDALFNVYVFGYVKKAVFINKCLNHYRKDNIASLTKTYKKDLFPQWQNLYNLMQIYIDDNNCGALFQTALQNRICLSIIGLGLNILNGGKSVKKIKEIKRIIGCEQYRKAYKQLTLKYFPIHWKLFFFFAKHNMAYGVYIMLKCINMLKGR